MAGLWFFASVVLLTVLVSALLLAAAYFIFEGYQRDASVQKYKKGSQVVLYDGICVMCDGFVTFCINRDSRELLRFAALDSVAGERLRKQYNLPNPPQSFVLIEDGVAYQRSDAAIRTLSMLTGTLPWSFMIGFMAMPTIIRHFCYDIGWNNRRMVFGTLAQCRKPEPKSTRFLTDGVNSHGHKVSA